jgi:hypothetical protein
LEPELQAVVLMNPAVEPPLQVPVPQASLSLDVRRAAWVEQVEAVELSLPVLRVQVLQP